MATTRDYTVEKDTTLRYDDVETASQDGKAEKPVDGGDYSGAVAKTDPAEIALVKKLDSRIMPALYVTPRYTVRCVRKTTNTAY
jgi:hypothetical protein